MKTTYFKRFAMLCLAALLMFTLTACRDNGGVGGTTSNNDSDETTDTGDHNTGGLTGSPQALLPELFENANAKLDELNQYSDTFDSEVTAEGCQFSLGVTADDFSKYAVSAYEAMALMMTNPQTTIIIQCADEKAATELSKLIAAGFDSGKWICVFPQRSRVARCGEYLLLAVGTDEGTQALIDAFGEMAGSAPVVETFSENEVADGEGDGIEFLP